MSFAIASLLKPFVAVAFLFLAHLIARSLSKVIPSGRVRDVLYDPTIAKRYPWRFGLLVVFGSYGFLGLIAYIVS